MQMLMQVRLCKVSAMRRKEVPAVPQWESCDGMVWYDLIWGECTTVFQLKLPRDRIGHAHRPRQAAGYGQGRAGHCRGRRHTEGCGSEALPSAHADGGSRRSHMEPWAKAQCTHAARTHAPRWAMRGCVVEAAAGGPPAPCVGWKALLEPLELEIPAVDIAPVRHCRYRPVRVRIPKTSVVPY
eukprot:SAG31_NODE_11053_length_1070_cov_1.761071_2_plen_183_part_00